MKLIRGALTERMSVSAHNHTNAVINLEKKKILVVKVGLDARKRHLKKQNTGKSRQENLDSRIWK